MALAQRSSSSLVDRIDDLKRSIRAEKSEKPFRFDVLVIMSDHLHAVWNLSENDVDFATRWKMIKA